MQVKVLNEKVKQLQKTGAPVICTGDFNAEENSVVYEEMLKTLSDTKYLAKQSDTGITYHDYGKYTDESGETIDFIFTEENLTVERYRIIDETVSGMFVSDHYGIAVDLRL